jgi:hypothetical protein
VVAFLRVMNGIYAPAPFQLRRPSRVLYGHCFDRALYRGFEHHLTPGIEWDEKRGRHATAAFERDAWDIALSLALNALLTPARRYQISSISIELADFICRPSARQTSLIAAIAPSISFCVRLLLTYRVAQLGSLAPIAEVTLPSSSRDQSCRSFRGAASTARPCFVSVSRAPRCSMRPFIATALTVSTVMPAFAHSVPVTMLRPETLAYLSKYRKYRAIRQFSL